MFDKYLKILEAENHNHPIVQDDKGIFRWKVQKDVKTLLRGRSLEELDKILVFLDVPLECRKKLYRSVGYSIEGYFKKFY